MITCPATHVWRQAQISKQGSLDCGISALEERELHLCTGCIRETIRHPTPSYRLADIGYGPQTPSWSEANASILIFDTPSLSMPSAVAAVFERSMIARLLTCV